MQFCPHYGLYLFQPPVHIVAPRTYPVHPPTVTRSGTPNTTSTPVTTVSSTMAKTDALNTTDVANTITSATVAAATATVAAAASNTTAVTVPAVSNENRLMKLKQKEMLLARLEKHRATIIKQK